MANINKMIEKFTDTAVWNDSADPDELKQAINWGTVGATCNPVIALTCIKQDYNYWKKRILEIANENKTFTESEIGWKAIEELSINAAKYLEPAFEKYNGYNGRLSVQVDPKYYKDKNRMVKQAELFSKLAKNIIVKIPATSIGIEAIEEATYKGVNINVTVSFSVAQAVGAAKAIERGLDKRKKENLDCRTMGPVVTIMVGRIDDHLKDVVKKMNVPINLSALEWAGIGIFKKAYSIFMKKNFSARLLSAAYRNYMQFTEFVGGKCVISPPFKWGKMIVDSNIELPKKIDTPINSDYLNELLKIDDFNKAYNENSMSVDEFDSFGPTVKTLRQFLNGDNEIDALVRDIIIPAV